MFGDTLKQLRKARGLSQQELGDLTQLGQSNISAWERGGRSPLPDGLIKLATFFECSIDYLVGYNKESNIDEAVNFYQKFKALSDEDQKKVKDLLNK